MGGGGGGSYLEGVALDDHGDVAVEALQPLLVETLQHIVAEVGDRHLQRLSHHAAAGTRALRDTGPPPLLQHATGTHTHTHTHTHTRRTSAP